MVNTWKIVTASLLIFATGVMTGALSLGLANSFSKRKPSERRLRPELVQPVIPNNLSNPISRIDQPMPPRSAPGIARLEVFRRLDRSLNLTPSQRERIGQLVDQTETRLHDLWQPVAPEAQRVLRDLKRQIQEEVLTQEQLPAFEKFLKNRSAIERGGIKKNPNESSRPYRDIP